MIALLCSDGQGGGSAFGLDRGLHQFARFAFAAAAAGGATGLRLHVLERVRATRDGAADVMVGNGLADADVHALFEVEGSTGAI